MKEKGKKVDRETEKEKCLFRPKEGREFGMEKRVVLRLHKMKKGVFVSLCERERKKGKRKE